MIKKYIKLAILMSAIIALPAYANKVVNEKHAAVCAAGAGGTARCHARVIVDSAGLPKTATAPSGYGPIQLHGGYAAQASAPNKQIIAVVDAYDDPNILSDLNNYSKAFSIPTMQSCGTPIASSASACFQKVNQRGGSKYPSTNSGWALEISLDVEIAHAMCQNCSILLVEADSNGYSNLFTAVNEAATLGASAISNSYGAAEFSGETGYDGYLNHPGVAITASSGDGGYGVEYPAASQYVTAVGGTTLFLNSDNSYNSETAWSGAGSGCSAFEPKLPVQKDPLCLNRTVADVSADADPNTGAAVYDSVKYQGRSGWFKVGGTSLSSPIIAAVYALAGGVTAGTQGNALPYMTANYSTNINDIRVGSNGSCGGTYLCAALPGYDGPTGIGTPIGLSAF